MISLGFNFPFPLFHTQYTYTHMKARTHAHTWSCRYVRASTCIPFQAFTQTSHPLFILLFHFSHFIFYLHLHLSSPSPLRRSSFTHPRQRQHWRDKIRGVRSADVYSTNTVSGRSGSSPVRVGNITWGRGREVGGGTEGRGTERGKDKVEKVG